MVPRWLPGSLLASLAVLMFVLPASAGSLRASSTITVLPDTVLRMAGSDILCTVERSGGKPAVACFHDPGGLSSSTRKGYAVAALDAGVVVEPPGSNTPVKAEKQPSLAADPLIKGGKSHSSLVTLSLGDAALIGGSRMAVAVQTAKGGGNAIGVVFLDANENPIVGSYTVGISNHFVTIVKVATASTTKVVYRHSVY